MSLGLATRRARTGHGLPLPPFGSVILDAVRRGKKPNVFIIAGSDAWDRHKIRTERVVLPPGTDPAEFDWSFMQGLRPTIVGDDCPRKILRKLAWCLLRAGCPLVALAYEDLVASALRAETDPIKYYDRCTIYRLVFFRNE